MTGSVVFKLAPTASEGPRGYLLRLAEFNGLTPNDLRKIGIWFEKAPLTHHGLLPSREADPELWTWVESISHLRNWSLNVWIREAARFCPLCLREHAVWPAKWELCFYDACATHGTWMLDSCTECGRHVGWQRPSLLHCQCGADLRMNASTPAPTELVRVSASLANKLSAHTSSGNPWPFDQLNLEDAQLLIRYLGRHFGIDGVQGLVTRLNPRTMRASVAVSAVAAPILCNWPTEFHARLSALQERFEDKGEKRRFMPEPLDRAGWYLTRRLKGKHFFFVHHAYHQWYVENWHGGVDHRNRWLDPKQMEEAGWISAHGAADRLGVTVERVRRLVADGSIEGFELSTPSGRRYLSVSTEELGQLTEESIGETTLQAAAMQLGFHPARFRGILKRMFPSASRSETTPGHTRWRISRSEVEAYLMIGQALPVLTNPGASHISLHRVLHYWCWSNADVFDLISAVKAGEVQLEGLLETGNGLNRWIFNTPFLKLWQRQRACGSAEWLSVDECAALMNLNPKAIYKLVEAGAVKTGVRGEFPRRGCRGGGMRIRRSEVERFRSKFVLASEISKLSGVHINTIGHLLEKAGIERASSEAPAFYQRTELLADALAALNIRISNRNI